MMKRGAMTAGAALLLAASGALATTDARRARLLSAMPAVDAYLRAHAAEAGCVGMAFGVVAGDRLLWAKGYGVRAPGTQEPVDSRTVFRIGSLTKTLTAVAILQLRDAGRLRFDAPAAQYLPELGNVAYPSPARPPITTRELLSHRSGLPRSGTFDYTSGRPGPTEAQLLASLDHLRLESVPGTRTTYSNLGFALLGLEVSRVSGEPYRAYVTRHILRPLGMTSSVWTPEAVPPGRLATGAALVNGRRQPVPHWRMGAAAAMGGLYSDVEDLAKYASFELSAQAPPGTAPSPVLRRSSLVESQSVQAKSSNGAPSVGFDWGLLDEPALGPLVMHLGQTGNYSASLRLLPRRGLGVVALCSYSGAVEALQGLTQHVLALTVENDAGLTSPLSAPLQQALARVRQELAHANGQELRALFTEGFLRSVTLPGTVSFFTRTGAASGSCGLARGISSDGPDGATAVLPCVRQSWTVSLTVEPKAPFRIQSLWIRPL